MRILTYGATGVQGGPVARLLASKGHQVRALVRDPQKASALTAAGIELAPGDLGDAASVEAATQGVERVFFHMPLVFDRETALGYARNVIDAAKRAGVELMVYDSSGIVPPAETQYLHLDLKREFEAHCNAVGLPMISLRPRLYYEVMLGPWIAQGLREQSTLAYPLPADFRPSWVTVEDVAAIAAACLERPDLAGSAINVGGPRPMSGTDLAEAFSRAWGRSIHYYPLPVADFEAGLKQAFGDHMGVIIAESFHYFNAIGPDGLTVDDATDTALSLGVTLTPFEDWILTQDWTAPQS